MKKNKNTEIVEKKLGISPDYQYKALNSSNYIQANWHHNKLKALSLMCKFNKKIAVLDLGTGSGNFEIFYSKKVKKITGVDYHKEALFFLKEKLKQKKINNVKLINKDIRSLSKIKKIGKYDLVVIMDTIEHINIKEANKLIKFLKKIVVSKGKICVITPNCHSTWIFVEKILDKLTIVPHFEGEQHLAKYCYKNLQEIFEENGFIKKNIKSFNLFSFLIPNKKISFLFCKLEIYSRIRFGNLLMGFFENEK